MVKTVKTAKMFFKNKKNVLEGSSFCPACAKTASKIRLRPHHSRGADLLDI